MSKRNQGRKFVARCSLKARNFANSLVWSRESRPVCYGKGLIFRPIRNTASTRFLWGLVGYMWKLLSVISLGLPSYGSFMLCSLVLHVLRRVAGELFVASHWHVTMTMLCLSLMVWVCCRLTMVSGLCCLPWNIGNVFNSCMKSDAYYKYKPKVSMKNKVNVKVKLSLCFLFI
jgi:hypothetical protein